MNYQLDGNKIIVLCENFDAKSIFECGQVFSYKKFDDIYISFPLGNLAAVYEENGKFVIEILKGDVDFFVNFFDLERDYQEIISRIKCLNLNFGKEILERAIENGKGIRILKQDEFETIVTFLFSQNNNIKRFTNSLLALRRDYGERIIPTHLSQNEKVNEILKTEKFNSFPSLEKLLEANEQYFSKIGAGYRANYLKETIAQMPMFLSQDFSLISTQELEEQLLKMKGIGLKVAMCIMLFGFQRFDVFPVDTWIRKVFSDFNTGENLPATAISRKLVGEFKDLSGFVQQYLFYFKRENG